MGENSIAAVEDYLELVDVPGFMDNRASRRFSLTGPGFNAGVMLIDLARVHREGTFQKTMLWLAENRKFYKPPPVGDSSRRSRYHTPIPLSSKKGGGIDEIFGF